VLGILQIISGPDKGRSLPLVRGKVQLIGRGPAAALRLTDMDVAPSHCQVVLEGEVPRLSDLGSGAGTLVNGEAITRHVLRGGDVIQIGQTRLAFIWTDSDEKITVDFPT
jgi:pSer/pThr/pTyr-binding forkhead associated (FHA) protein